MLIFIESKIRFPNNQKIERTIKETIDARIYIDLTWFWLNPDVKPAKIGTREIGSIATNMRMVLSIKVSNIF